MCVAMLSAAIALHNHTMEYRLQNAQTHFVTMIFVFNFQCLPCSSWKIGCYAEKKTHKVLFNFNTCIIHTAPPPHDNTNSRIWTERDRTKSDWRRTDIVRQRTNIGRNGKWSLWSGLSSLFILFLFVSFRSSFELVLDCTSALRFHFH